jgi:hypothetical protein
MPAVHPAWRNVNFVFGRFSRFDGWCRGKLLNNNDFLLADATHTKKSKTLERAPVSEFPDLLLADSTRTKKSSAMERA